jgi:hypothetical protein
MRGSATIFGRALVLFLGIAVADVPIICADERPCDETSSARARPAGDLASVEIVEAGTGSDDGPCCFCPCHSTFRSAERCELLSSGSSVEQIVTFRARATPGPPRSLDHPPQNFL